MKRCVNGFRSIFLVGKCIILVLSISSIKAQKLPVFLYDFNGCSLFEASNFGTPAFATQTPRCACGLDGESLTFNALQTVTFDKSINQLFYSDFTIDFYFRLTPGLKQIDLLSLKSSCATDSTIFIKYLPQEKNVIVELDDGGLSYNLRGAVGPNCWTRVTLVRSALNYELYIDNKLSEVAQVSKEIPISNSARLRLSGSPCTDVNIEPLLGNIDQLAIYNLALNPQDLRTNYAFPNMVVNNDTTIVAGNAVQINAGATCFDNFVWSPTTGLSDPNTLDPIASPTVTTNYLLIVNDGTCIDSSDVTINVIDPSAQQCDKLFFPSAFTPNNDNLNDDIGISNTFIIDEIKHYEILDRWGGRLAYFKDKSDRWNGTINGKPAGLGAYHYNINYTCKGQEYKSVGSFMIIR